MHFLYFYFIYYIFRIYIYILYAFIIFLFYTYQLRLNADMNKKATRNSQIEVIEMYE